MTPTMNYHDLFEEELNVYERYEHLKDLIRDFRKNLKSTVRLHENYTANIVFFQQYVSTPKDQATYDSYEARFNDLRSKVRKLETDFRPFYSEFTDFRKEYDNPQNAHTVSELETMISSFAERFLNFREEEASLYTVWKILYTDFDDFKYDLAEKIPPKPQSEKPKDVFTVLSEKMDALSEKMDQKFDAFDKKFDSVDKRFDDVDERFNAVDERFNAVDERFNAVDERFDAVEGRLTSVEGQLSSVDSRLTSVEGQLSSVDSRLTSVEKRLSSLKNTVDNVNYKADRNHKLILEVKNKTIPDLTGAINKCLNEIESSQAAMQVHNIMAPTP